MGERAYRTILNPQGKVMTEDTHRMRIVLVGAGNLATNLGHALMQSGHRVVQVFSRTTESANDLADKLVCESTCSIDGILTDADLYIVSIKDSALAEIAGALTAVSPEALWVHTAGSMPMDVLPCRRRGVFYPMQTFSKQTVADFRTIPIFLETSDASDMQMLQSIARKLSDTVYELDSETRKHLHLAAVFCCNFANHCCAVAADLLDDKNIPFEVMLPLIDRTMAKLHTLTPLEAQTGPAVRYDTNVIERHLHLLDSRPDLQQIYKLMSKSIYAYKGRKLKKE